MYSINVPMLLSEMKEKQTGRIVRVGGNGALRKRILEMGITKGSEIYVEKYAPLKDPVELIVRLPHISSCRGSRTNNSRRCEVTQP